MAMTRTLKLLLLAVIGCSALTASPPGAVAADVVVYAAGDIACDPADPSFNDGAGTASACRMQATADLMAGAGAVLALGDLQYNAASLPNFQASYNRSWGAFKSVTFPVVGNHEGVTATTGAGYCAYFGPAAHCNASGRQGGAAYYSFNLGDWHVAVLNSNCVAAGGCQAGSPQYQWLAADLAANPRACTMALWHHPRWSSGYGGSNAMMQPLWQLLYANGGDLVLSGHSHDYERFAPIDGAGTINLADGMRSFVVGTGGAYFTSLGPVVAGSEVRQNTTFGVLRLILHPTSYDWQFLPASGSTFTDAGSQSCRVADTLAPSAPSRLSARAEGPTRVALSWAGSADNVGVAGYEIWRGRRNGAMAMIATTSATGAEDVGVRPRRRYRYQVRARDAAGNVSALSNAGSVTTPGRPGELLARWRLTGRVARRVLARGRVRIPARRWAPTVIRVRVSGRLAGRRQTRLRRALRVKLAPWTARRRYRQRSVTVTIRSPLTTRGASPAGGAAVAIRRARG
jgi:hypothetical protein